MTLPNLATVKTLAKQYPEVITEGSLRWQIFRAKENGLEKSGAIIRCGRKVVIDVDRYFAWLYRENSSGADGQTVHLRGLPK